MGNWNIIDIMAKGGSVANQAFANASTSISRAGNLLTQSGSLAMKLLALLEEEEARKNQQLQQTLNLMRQAQKDEFEKQLKLAKLNIENREANSKIVKNLQEARLKELEAKKRMFDLSKTINADNVYYDKDTGKFYTKDGKEYVPTIYDYKEFDIGSIIKDNTQTKSYQLKTLKREIIDPETGAKSTVEIPIVFDERTGKYYATSLQPQEPIIEPTMQQTNNEQVYSVDNNGNILSFKRDNNKKLDIKNNDIQNIRTDMINITDKLNMIDNWQYVSPEYKKQYVSDVDNQIRKILSLSTDDISKYKLLNEFLQKINSTKAGSDVLSYVIPKYENDINLLKERYDKLNDTKSIILDKNNKNFINSVGTLSENITGTIFNKEKNSQKAITNAMAFKEKYGKYSLTFMPYLTPIIDDASSITNYVTTNAKHFIKSIIPFLTEDVSEKVNRYLTNEFSVSEIGGDRLIFKNKESYKIINDSIEPNANKYLTNKFLSNFDVGSLGIKINKNDNIVTILEKMKQKYEQLDSKFYNYYDEENAKDTKTTISTNNFSDNTREKIIETKKQLRNAISNAENLLAEYYLKTTNIVVNNAIKNLIQKGIIKDIENVDKNKLDEIIIKEISNNPQLYGFDDSDDFAKFLASYSVIVGNKLFDNVATIKE